MRWKGSVMEGVQLLHVALRQIRNEPRGAEVRQWQRLDEKCPIEGDFWGLWILVQKFADAIVEVALITGRRDGAFVSVVMNQQILINVQKGHPHIVIVGGAAVQGFGFINPMRPGTMHHRFARPRLQRHQLVSYQTGHGGMAIPTQSSFVVVVHPYFVEAYGKVMNEERQHKVVIRGKERHDFGDGL